MVKLNKCLFMEFGKKCIKVSEIEKSYESVHDAFWECYLEVFHMPDNFQLSLQTIGKPAREIALFVGMDGELEGAE